MDSLIPDTPRIVIPKGQANILHALLQARADGKAAERVKAIAGRKLCLDCMNEIDLVIERSDAVADAMAALIGVQCPVCCKRYHNYAEMTAQGIGQGKCIQCGTAIVLEE